MRFPRWLPIVAVAVLLGVPMVPAGAQESGTVQGTVTRSDGGARISGVNVRVQGTAIETATRADGSYQLTRVPAGEQTLLFRWVGFEPQERKVAVTAGGTATADVALEARPVMLSEIVVSTASRAPERVVEAPAAVTQIDTRAAQAISLTGQAPLAIANVPGVDVVQSGVNDININARGFNSSLNRRVLILQDGRDLAVAFLGSQEWNAMSTALEDVSKMEMVRGPGSALYGANAFSGVLSITTPSAREVVGTKLTIGAGELASFRGDLRHAGVLGGGQVGYKVQAGYNRSDTWSRSRTALDSLDMRREYTPATDPTLVPKVFEVSPLNGQTLAAGTRVATGDRKDLVNMYGTARLDYYANNGSVGTVEGGGSQVENEIFVTGIGRVQILKAMRPWVRANWGAENYNLMAWYSGRKSGDSTAADPVVNQRILGSGAQLADLSDMFHVEGQYNRAFAQDKFRAVAGGSYRSVHENTKGTLMDPADDNRTDNYYSGFGQLEFKPSKMIRAVGAVRFDDGTLFKGQVSPKAALVISPNDKHSVRFTFNRAFQTPNYSEFYLRAPVAAPQAGPRQLELGIEALFNGIRANPSTTPLANALALPTDLNWSFSTSTPALALGNRNLDVEHVTGYEVGYKGELSKKLFVTVDLYLNQLTNFVTDLLGGVNPAYPNFSLTAYNVPMALAAIDAQLAAGGAPAGTGTRLQIAQLQAGYAGVAANQSRISTMPDGTRAIVVSYANAGKVNERGVEFGAGLLLTNELKLDLSYTFFDFDVKSQQAGDSLLPNTPKHKGSAGLSYSGRQGLDVAVSVKLNDKFGWAAGVFNGPIPTSQTVNASIGYQVTSNFRISAVGTNILDQQRYQLYGGSVIGRRVLAGVTATF